MNEQFIPSQKEKLIFVNFDFNDEKPLKPEVLRIF